MNLVNFNKHRADFLRGLRYSGLVGMLFIAANFSLAQNDSSAAASAASPTPESLSTRYPSGSIQSTDMANQALMEVDQQRNQLDQEYAAEQHVCYTKFLATSCLDAAKERRRLALAQIRKVEVEANAFIRSARVVERDKRLAEKRANDVNNPPKLLSDVSPKQTAAPRAGDGDQRIANHEAKLQEQKQAEKDDAQKRAESITAFNKKQKDAEDRQRDVAAKKAEKERQAAAKAAAAASASGISAAKP